MRFPRYAAAATAVAAAAAATLPACETHFRGLGFTPVAAAPQPCSATTIQWPRDVIATPVMKAGDPATPTTNALANQTTVPAENDMIAFDPSGRFLYTVSETPDNGAVTRLDTLTNSRVILAQRPDWNRLDPVKWHGASGKLLIGEEDGANGSVWQVDPVTGVNVELPWLGKMSHEGIAFAVDGAIWEGDENHTGAVYRAVPADPRDLTKGGTLTALVDGTGFVPITNPGNAVGEAYGKGATLFDRPEDFEFRAGHVYFSVTEPADDAQASSKPGHPVRAGGVYRVRAVGTPPHVGLFVSVNDPAVADRSAAHQVRGLQFPDNLAFDPSGNLYIHEDVADDTGTSPTDVHSKQFRDQQDELWVARPDRNRDDRSDGLGRFANLANSPHASPCQNEWTGGVFGPNGDFYVNQQHADGITWRVRFGSLG